MTSEPFDVVVVPFPFNDRRAAKRRPALLVSSDGFNRGHGHSILAMITSSRSEWPSDVVLKGWRKAGLVAPCKVRFKLFTLDDELIVRTLGALTDTDRQAVQRALFRFMAVH